MAVPNKVNTNVSLLGKPIYVAHIYEKGSHKFFNSYFHIKLLKLDYFLKLNTLHQEYLQNLGAGESTFHCLTQEFHDKNIKNLI